MSHFRVENARFRILKGGKIGLSLSIALASSLILYPVDGNAQTFFDKAPVVTDLTAGDITLKKYEENNPNNKENYSIIDSILAEDIIFKPNIVERSFVGIENFKIDGTSPNQSSILDSSIGILTGTYNNIENGQYTTTEIEVTKTNYDKYYYENYSPRENFTVVLENGTIAKDIKKENSTYHDIIDFTTNEYTTSTKEYTANIEMKEDSTVTGIVVLDAQDSIKLNGAGIVFGDTVDTGDIIVNNNGASAIFKNQVNVVDGLKYNQAGTVTLEGGLKGDIKVDNGTKGILILSSPTQQVMEGSVGSTTGKLDTIDVQSGTHTTFIGGVYSQNITSTGTGITEFRGAVNTANLKVNDGKIILQADSSSTNTTIGSGRLDLENGADLSGTTVSFTGDGSLNLNNSNLNLQTGITTSAPNQGNINLNGTNTISGTVGTNYNKLNTIEANGASNSTFNNVVNTNSLNVNSGNMTFKDTLNATNTTIGSGSLDLENGADLSGTTVNFTADGNLKLSDGSDLTVTNGITSTSGNNGKITIAGSSNISGNIGAGTNKISEININGASGKTVELKDNINATTTKINGATVNFNTVSGTTNTNIDFTGTGIANLNQGITGNIDFAGNSATVNVENGDITGSVSGTAGTLNMKGSSLNLQTITGSVGNINQFNINSGITTVNGDINAQNTNLSANTTLNAQGNITGNINGASNSNGTLNMNGSVDQTITGNIGNTNAINSFDIDSGKIVTVTGNINATNTNINNDSTLELKGNINSNIGGVVGNSGTLTMNGSSNQTIDGTLGNIANLNIDNGNNKVTSNTDINATNTYINSTLELISGKNISSIVNGNGTLELLGSSIVNNQIQSLYNLSVNANGSNSTFNSTVNSTNIISTGNGSSTFKDIVNSTNVNVNDGIMRFEKNLTATTTTIGSGIAHFNTVSGNTNTNIVFSGNGTANLNQGITGDINFAGNSATVNVENGDITGSVSGTAGTLNMKGSSLNPQTITGSVGNIEDFNIKSGITTVNGDINATNTIISSNLELRGNIDSNISGAVSNSGTLTMNGSSNQTIRGTLGNIANLYIDNGTKKVTSYTDIDAINTDISSTLELDNSKNISSNITGTGNLFLKGDNVVSNVVNMTGDVISYGDVTFESTLSAGNLEINSGTTTAKGNVTATNTKIGSGSLDLENGADLSGTTVNFTANGDLNLSDGSDITVTNGITSNSGNSGKINIAGNSTITGDIGTSTDKISEININGASGKTVNLKDNVYSETTKIDEATVNFNKNSGDTNTNLLFLDNAVANLNGDLIGSINFQDTDAVVNVKDGKSIIGSVNSNINGTINYEGGGSLGKTIDENDSGNIVLGTLNVNTKNHQNKGGEIVPDDGLYIHRDIYADRINLQNNATLVLDNADLYALNDDKILIETDQDGQGDVIFNSSSIVNAQLAQNDKKLSSINAGNNGDKVVFNEDIFADRLNFLGDGNIVLNKEFDSLVDFKNKSGKLELADGINISEDGISFENANNATLKLNGDSTISRVLGDKNSGTSTFKNIEAGNSGKAVSFLEDIYIKDKLDIIGNGVVNLDGNLYSNLNFSEDGIVNIADGKSISKAITTNTDGKGNIIFEGETELNNNIGTKDYLLRNVVFGSLKEGDFNQKIDKDIYAQNTIIGNGENSSKISFDNNTKFGGNVYINNNSNLNINDNKIDIYGGLVLGENSQLNYKVHTDDLKGNAQESGNSGKITADSLALDKDTKFHIDYDGTWEGKGQYNLIETNNDILTNYIGNEKNGLVSDNSIIDSVIISDGTNLVLKADRTGGDDYRPEDLYIVKSEIGNDYSNGASQSLAGYANGSKREDALADIIRDLEYLEGGITITDEKKAQMIDIQRKLAPKANSATVQSAINVSKVSNEMVSSRIADIRRDIFEDRLAYAVDNSPTFTGYNSGDDYYYDVGDSTLWIKASYAKATQDAVKSYDGYKTKSYGATAGIDKVVGDDVIFGISASYFDTKVTQNRGDDDTKSYRGTIYGSSEFGLAYVDANVSFAHHETDSSREANSGKLSSKIKAQELSARVETGLNLPIDDGSYITPYVAVEHSIYKQKAYQEKGSKYQNDALKVDAVNLNTTSAEIGAKLTGRIELENALIIPHLSASVTNNFNQKNKDVKAQFVGGGSKFSTPHQDLHKTIYSVGTGIEARITNNSSIILDATYDRSKDGKYRAYGANVSFGLSF